jgi:integrase
MPRHGSNIRQTSGGRWQASYRKLDGREVSRTFDRRTDAARWRRDGLAARDRGEYLDPKAGQVIVRDYGERWRQAQLHHRWNTARATEAVLRLHLYPHLGDRPMNRVTRTDIASLVKVWVEGGAAPLTIRNSRYKVVQALFRAAVGDDVIRKSPCDGTNLPEVPPRVVDVLDAEQVRALADAIDPRYRALVLLGHGCGLRISEATGLTASNVSWLAGEINVTQQLDGRPPYALVPLKTSRRRPSRVVPMPRYVHEALSRHVEVYGLGERDLVFTTAQGGPLGTGGKGFSQCFRRAVREAGLPSGITFHTLRHSYATEAIARGLSETDVAELLGDTVAMVHQTYGHPSVDFRRRARLAMEAAWEAGPAAVADSSRTASLAQVRDLR